MAATVIKLIFKDELTGAQIAKIGKRAHTLKHFVRQVAEYVDLA